MFQKTENLVGNDDVIRRWIGDWEKDHAVIFHQRFGYGDAK